MTKPEFKFAPDMAGQGHVGFMRTDASIFHTIARAPQGAIFTVGDHFETCSVCKSHEITEADFIAFMSSQNAVLPTTAGQAGQLVVQNHHNTKCPTCNADVIFDLDECSVFHALPMCDDFEKRDALEYATFVREHQSS